MDPILLTSVSFCLFTFLTILGIRYRHHPSGPPYILAMLFLVLLAFASMGEWMATQLTTMVYWRNVQQISFISFPLIILWIHMEIIGLERRVIFRRLIIAGLPLLVYLLLIFTDSMHHWMRLQVDVITRGGYERTVVQSTLLSHLFLAYTRILMIVSIVALYLDFKNVTAQNRKQYYYIILGMVIPFCSALIPETSKWQVDTAIAAIPTGIIYFYCLFHHKVLNIIPVANEKIIQSIREGIVVTDKHDFIVQTNLAAEHILQQLCGQASTTFVGKKLYELLRTSHQELLTLFDEKQDRRIEIQVHHTVYQVEYMGVQFSHNNKGAILIFTDVTEQKKVIETLKIRASIDSLTHVHNRQYLEEVADKMIDDMRQGQLISFIMLDIDDFKLINDTYGHETGDRTLRVFARCLQDTVKGIGSVARIGGEEFAILTSKIDEQEALELAKLIQHNVSKLKISVESEQDAFTFTVSVGLTTVSDRNCTFTQIFKQADEALYQSKRNGKNQITVNH